MPESPGFRRLRARLGRDKAEALRQQVLEEQRAALVDAGKHRPINERDRTIYHDYPIIGDDNERA